MQTSILNNNTASNSSNVGHSNITSRFGFTEINGQLLNEALSNLDSYLDDEKYYVSLNWSQEEQSDWAQEEVLNAFHQVLGWEIDFPSDRSLGHTGHDSVYSITREAIEVAYSIATTELDNIEDELNLIRANRKGGK